MLESCKSNYLLCNSPGPYLERSPPPAVFHQHKAPSSNGIQIDLPKNGGLNEALFFLFSCIRQAYRQLPWPPALKKVVLLTELLGGRGDIAAAAKIITLMQRLCPQLTFDWVVVSPELSIEELKQFLSSENNSKISVRKHREEPSEKEAADLLITGPVELSWRRNYMENLVLRKIEGPTFGFMEIAKDPQTFDDEILDDQVELLSKKNLNCQSFYQRLHPILFPGNSDCNKGLLPMGLQRGSGILLDQTRMTAPLSRDDCCPSYLLQLEDLQLRSDILEAMGVLDKHSQPNYDQYSLNSGYAHHPDSREEFIDCVAIHEKSKHLVIVLNQEGVYVKLSTQAFAENVFTEKRLSFLQKRGYSKVVVKGKEEEPIALLSPDASGSIRQLTVIIRPFFTPGDMQKLQLASERLLATGDNSAVEAWCARCKLYLYEDVANGGCKSRFLQQQVDLAKTISGNLSKLLALFGGDSRLKTSSRNKPPSEEKMAEIEQILNDPNLAEETLQFCNHITSHYSFDGVFEAALKRTLWHHHIPELATIEAETLDSNFQSGIITHLKNPGVQNILQVAQLIELKGRVQKMVLKHLHSL